MSKLLLFVLFLFSHFLYGQTAEYVYRNAKDSSYNCYLTILPDSTDIVGLVVRDFSSLPNLAKKSPYKWSVLALENGLAIVYTVSSNQPAELFYDDSSPVILDNIINEVVLKHTIPKNNVFIGGISASGTRALRYAQFCEQGKSNYNIKVKGVFAVDPPLDIERFYYSALWHKHLFREGMLSEAEFVLKEFPRRLASTPRDSPDKYRAASVFSYLDKEGGNASYYKNLSMLFFHEPDIDWWLQERGVSYFDLNSFDIVGFVNYMNHIGTKDISLITTTNKGFDRNGDRNCHSWTIVDENLLMDWILERVEMP